ncbi:MAG: histidine kinase [Bacteroidota bacterium]|jgi:CheY-like chemotaxis protein|nr:histidine kinase [Bacteroidota bacterium]
MISEGTLILIEDQDSDIQLFKEAAKELGFDNKVKICSSGEQALEYLKELGPKTFLILCDMNMPKMTGMELKRELENTSKMVSKTIPFVFFSTAQDEALLKEAYELGAHGYFLKGDSYEEYRDTLEVMINYWDRSFHPKED